VQRRPGSPPGPLDRLRAQSGPRRAAGCALSRLPSAVASGEACGGQRTPA